MLAVKYSGDPLSKMKLRIVIFTLLLVGSQSCSNSTELAHYKDVVFLTDSIVQLQKDGIDFKVLYIYNQQNDLKSIKELLTRKVVPEEYQKTEAVYKIDLYKQRELVGVILFSGSEDAMASFVDSTSKFSFRFSYQLGQSF